ncbi:hypothetical protein ACTSKR_01270 [Chitinibacteraceae bacterium HSL-7]
MIQVIVVHGTECADLIGALQRCWPESLHHFGYATLAAGGQTHTATLERALHYALPALLQAGLTLVVDHDWRDDAATCELLTELAGYSVLLVDAGASGNWDYDVVVSGQGSDAAAHAIVERAQQGAATGAINTLAALGAF